ncbi:MAG: hypothetical protein EZS28_008130 [Streblomastix strix]|uniref:Uncharacterized protein n=1 Tax=Streblomastix strix TaxID=222440 RepID=A0A5J4WPP0_9EUKA|nr:MAG: hypothetical protein EZS28_008130 [Streblomastix strix]
MLRRTDLIPVRKDGEGQYLPAFGPEVPQAVDWRRPKRQSLTPQMDEVRAFWREYNFDLRVACVKKDESGERSGSRDYSRPSDYESPREIRIDIDRNQHGYESRGDSRCRGRGTFIGRDYNYQRIEQINQDRDQSNQERYREAQKYNPYTKRAFTKTKNPINWNTSHQYDNKNKRDGSVDDPNDEWPKYAQTENGSIENYGDRYPTSTEDDAPKCLIAAPQYKQPLHAVQRLHHVQQMQPKLQVLAQVQQQRGRREQVPNFSDIDEQEIIQERQAALQLEKEEYGIYNSENDWWQGTVGQLTGLQPSSGAQSPSLSAELRLKETGSIQASNRERTNTQIIESHEDNAEEEQYEQIDEATLIRIKDYRVNEI